MQDQQPSPTKNLLLAAATVLFGVALGWMAYSGVGGHTATTNKTQMSGDMSKIEPAAGAKTQVGGAFSMVDQNDHPVTEKDYADRYKLIYFGFTHCPDVCPAAMQKMSMILDKLGESAAKLHPLFVTVDPVRDTPEVMREYTSVYDNRIIGLTGSEEQVKDMIAAFHVYAKKVPDTTIKTDHSTHGKQAMEHQDQGTQTQAAQEHMNYMMNHSGYFYLMDKDDNLVNVYSGTSDTPAEISAKILKILGPQ